MCTVLVWRETLLLRVAAAAAAILIHIPVPFAAADHVDLEEVRREWMRPSSVAPSSSIDRDGVAGRVLCGYQGWFTAEGDGAGLGWRHWRVVDRGVPQGSRITFDMLPDVSELTAEERFASDLIGADGRPIELFSSHHSTTVLRHFQWMRDYGIDGAFVQRFAVNLGHPKRLANVTKVLGACRDGALRHGRVYAVMYDLSGMKAGTLTAVTEDWRYLRDRMKIGDDTAALRVAGKPLVAVWGVGFNDGRDYTLEECRDLIATLKADGCAVLCGVPTGWRTLDRDAVGDPLLHEVVGMCDVVCPWTVGRYQAPEQALRHAERDWKADIAWCGERGITFLPVAFPGFSWHNLKGGKLDQIPRLGGRFLWSQAVGARQAGAESLYVAMFDEVDEATAIFKCIEPPTPELAQRFVGMEGLPSDHYLRLTGEIGRMLRGERPVSDELPSAASRRPNVVFMLADDLGWGDISCHGGATLTPAIDRLFAAGVELTQCMAWCVCSPTRAMLLTGRHPFRVGTGPEVGGELAAEETTIAEVFQAAGYRTGVFGKWHNGEDPDTPEYREAFAGAWKHLPNKKPVFGLGANTHGFDEAWVYYGGGADFFTRRTVSNRGPVSWWHNNQYRPRDEGYTEDLITDRACEFLRASAQAGKPFFCYVPFHLVHAPMQAKDDDLAAVDPAVTDPDKRVYAAMVRALDANVARILATLDDLGVRDDTIVVFTSDNGATAGGSNLPLRGTKHTVYDGGVRMPTVIHCAKRGLAGRHWGGLCSAVDMLPSLASLAGISLPPTRPLDGQNISTALRADAESPVESVYWGWRGVDALRTQRWKLHRFFDRVELYDMEEHPGEIMNMATERQDVVAELLPKIDAWVVSLSAALSHKPPALDAKPAPSGDVLEVSVTVTEKARPADQLLVHFATLERAVQASDHLEFDIAAMPDSLPDRFFYTPFKNGEQGKPVRFFKRGDGIDQFGREQVLGPAPRVPSGAWEHRVIGLCSFAPGVLPLHGLVFTGGRPGNYRVRLDNLRLRHVDGTTTAIWTDMSQTRFRRIADSEAFTGLVVKVVAADVASIDDTPPRAGATSAAPPR